MAFDEVIHAAHLEELLFWCCLPENIVALDNWQFAQKIANSVSAALRNSDYSSSVKELQDTLSGCRTTGVSSGRSVRVIFPELMQELEFCRWNGDGHFHASKITEVSPPTLGQIVSFVSMVTAENCATIVLSSQKHRGTGAVLVGAVPILAKGAIAANVHKLLPKAAGSSNKASPWDRFPPPFDPDGRCSSSSLTVLDCLESLQVARAFGWLDYRAFDAGAWKYLREKFDMSWIVPDKILALGHPSLTADNPKFPGLLSPSGVESTATPSSSRAGDFDTPTTESHTRSAGSTPYSLEDAPTEGVVPHEGESFLQHVAKLASPSIDGHASFMSVERGAGNQIATPLSVMNERGSPSNLVARRQLPSEQLQVEVTPCLPELANLKKDTFTSFFCRHDVGMLVRLNFEREYNMEGYSNAFRNMKCICCEFDDGTAPSQESARMFTDMCRNHNETVPKGSGHAIAVHCRLGLGRTGAQVGAYMNEAYGIRGSTIHGWLRLARPGMVQTPQQERFVRALGGQPDGKSSGTPAPPSYVIVKRLKNSISGMMTLKSPVKSPYHQKGLHGETSDS